MQAETVPSPLRLGTVPISSCFWGLSPVTWDISETRSGTKCPTKLLKGFSNLPQLALLANDVANAGRHNAKPFQTKSILLQPPWYVASATYITADGEMRSSQNSWQCPQRIAFTSGCAFMYLMNSAVAASVRCCTLRSRQLDGSIAPPFQVFTSSSGTPVSYAHSPPVLCI